MQVVVGLGIFFPLFQVSGWILQAKIMPQMVEIEGFAATHCNCKKHGKISKFSKDVKPNQFINEFRNHIYIYVYINNVKDKRKSLGNHSRLPRDFFGVLLLAAQLNLPVSVQSVRMDFLQKTFSHPAHP